MGSVIKRTRRAADNVAYIKAPEIEIPEITLVEMFNAAAKGNDDRFAIDFLGKKTTYAELAAASDRVARGLQDQGFKKGDKVVLYMPNSSYYPMMMLGVWKAGGTVVNMLPNTRQEMKDTPHVYAQKLRDLLKKTDARFMATLDLPEYLDVSDKGTFGTKTQNVIVCPMAKALPPLKEVFYPAKLKAEPLREAIHNWWEEIMDDIRRDIEAGWKISTWENFKELVRKFGAEWHGLADLWSTIKIFVLATEKGHHRDYLRYTWNRYFPKNNEIRQTITPPPTKPAIENSGAQRLDFWTMTDNDGLYKQQNMKPSDIAVLQPTGGTTGTPKLAMLSHRNMVANVSQAIFQYTDHLHTDPHGEYREMIADPLPFAHVFSFVIGPLYSMMTGAQLATMPDPKDTASILSMLHRTKATALLAVPKIIMNIAELESTPCYDLSSLDTSIIGGDELTENVTRGFEEATGLEGVLYAGYGATEASPTISSNSDRYGNKPGTIGHLFPGMEARIVSNDGTGRIENRGVNGKLQVRGPNVMLGYFNDKAETDKVLSEDGWLDVGDNCIINKDDSITFFGRDKRVADINGIKVFAQPVESKLQSESSVAEAVIITVADSRSSEALKAIVRLQDGVNEDGAAERLKAYIQQSLGKQNVPKHFEFVTERLPKTAAGKADWLKLQTEHWDRHIEKTPAPAPSI